MTLHAVNVHKQHGGKDPYSVLHISFMLLLADFCGKESIVPNGYDIAWTQELFCRNICLCWEVNLVQQT
jgi:hypothetical protein